LRIVLAVVFCSSVSISLIASSILSCISASSISLSLASSSTSSSSSSGPALLLAALTNASYASRCRRVN
jgi:hypothetical protein